MVSVYAASAIAHYNHAFIADFVQEITACLRYFADVAGQQPAIAKDAVLFQAPYLVAGKVFTRKHMLAVGGAGFHLQD